MNKKVNLEDLRGRFNDLDKSLTSEEIDERVKKDIWRADVLRSISQDIVMFLRASCAWPLRDDHTESTIDEIIEIILNNLNNNNGHI